MLRKKKQLNPVKLTCDQFNPVPWQQGHEIFEYIKEVKTCIYGALNLGLNLIFSMM